MSARRTRTLSRLFQATMRMLPEKKSGGVEGAAAVLSEKGLAFESESSSKEHEMVWHYHTKLVFKDGKFVDMDLVDKKRRLLCAGKLFRQSDSAFERRGQIELFVLLFDNYLVMTKPVGKRPDTTFHVHKKPIPLDLLELGMYAEMSTRIRRRSTILLWKDDTSVSHRSESGVSNITDDRRGTFPFTITFEGGSYTLYADDEVTRLMWRSKIEEAIQIRQQFSQVFKVKMLNRESFLMKTGTPSGYLPEGRQLTRTINCVTPFKTRDGRNLMAIGCVEGLWIGNICDSQSFHRILPLQMIRQCAVLEECGIFLILAHNHLCAYDLESCVPTSAGPQSYHPPQKLNQRGEVSFFRVGMVDGRVHVIFARKKRMDTIFQTFEVVRSIGQERTLISSDAKPEWFRLYREFSLPSDCTDAIFMHRRLIILHRNGFYTVDLLGMLCIDIPLPAERNTGRKSLIKKCASGQPLGMFRLQRETFLLCYDKFGVYMDKHGTLISDRVAVEWEGLAERVSYHYPFVFLFSSKFVEVRHANSGRLEQIIRGNGMRCIWEGEGRWDDDPTTVPTTQNPTIIGVTNAPAGLDELAVQCIFTLVPSDCSLSPTQKQPSLSAAEDANTRL